MDLGVAGKVALVTASSRGLGRGSALALSREGAKVVLCARDEQRLNATAADLPGETLAVAADVTEPDVPASLVRMAVERFGGLDILVGNSGGPPPARAFDVDEAGVLAAVNENLLTQIRLAQSALPHMRSAGWGRIVLITSSAIKQPIPSLAYSNIARTGLWAWAKTAAQDLAGSGITLNLVAPGFHATDRTRELGSAGPMGDAEDFGRIVAFLCSQAANFVSGTALQVDGGGSVGLL
ncbi:MAG: 3-oxoacyl-[acyl-carrier protein] reductase [Actinomycetota bacterium]|nr:3-oxoacyl-[acyl-carrier protein] reductase [Actinomycetota bacterium]